MVLEHSIFELRKLFFFSCFVQFFDFTIRKTILKNTVDLYSGINLLWKPNSIKRLIFDRFAPKQQYNLVIPYKPNLSIQDDYFTNTRFAEKLNELKKISYSNKK